LTIKERTFTLENVMNLIRTQTREQKQIGTICRGALFCGYFGGISGSGSRPMTHSPARSTWLSEGNVDRRGG
jgi:hypothetical protein